MGGNNGGCGEKHSRGKKGGSEGGSDQIRTSVLL